MINIKQFLAFPMFATAAWLVWVLAVQRGADAVAAVLAGMLFLALGLWTWERSRESAGRWRLLGAIASAAFGAFALLLGALPGRVDFGSIATEDGLQRQDSRLLSQPFSRERLQAARAQRRPVFVNMTAAWCITCLVNERLALSSVRVAQAFDASEVLYLKGDWTNHECPYVRKHYSTRNMQSLQKEAAGKGFVWLSVISSAPGKQGHVSPEEASRLTKERNAFPKAVLLDETGEMGRAYNASTTPHMFIIGPDGILLYMGGIDDRPTSNVKDVETAENYVRKAIADISAGRGVAQAITRPYGCSVKY